jgi:hypothetical protein
MPMLVFPDRIFISAHDPGEQFANDIIRFRVRSRITGEKLDACRFVRDVRSRNRGVPEGSILVKRDFEPLEGEEPEFCDCGLPARYQYMVYLPDEWNAFNEDCQIIS